MQFKDGAKVLTADGQPVGKVDRVVLNPLTKAVTGVVVHKGFLDEDKVIPVDFIATTTEDQIVLDKKAGDPNRLPVFEETHYIPVSTNGRVADQVRGYIRPLYTYPPLGMPYGYPYTPFVSETERNIPPGTLPLKEGAVVVSADHHSVGRVEQVFTDPRSDRATHIVICKGFLSKERKLIPTTWIKKITEEQVQLAVDARLLDSLSTYQG